MNDFFLRNVDALAVFSGALFILLADVIFPAVLKFAFIFEEVANVDIVELTSIGVAVLSKADVFLVAKFSIKVLTMPIDEPTAQLIDLLVFLPQHFLLFLLHDQVVLINLFESVSQVFCRLGLLIIVS